jgi:hypothetical protein
MGVLTEIYAARAEVRFRLTRSRRCRRLQIGRHQRKRLRLRVKHTISHRARYNEAQNTTGVSSWYTGGVP